MSLPCAFSLRNTAPWIKVNLWSEFFRCIQVVDGVADWSIGWSVDWLVGWLVDWTDGEFVVNMFQDIDSSG